MNTADHITFLYECVINDGSQDEWQALWDELTDFAAGEPGTVEYQCHRSDREGEICLFERYADSAAAITHMQGFGPTFGERFTQMVTMCRVVVLGPVSPGLAEMIAPMLNGVVPNLDAAAFTGGAA